MKKHTLPAKHPKKPVVSDAFLAAESVQRDFSELVGLFKWYLDALGEGDDEQRVHIADAKIAAERGFKLSSDLVALMKACD
jgi:hypothetical protein